MCDSVCNVCNCKCRKGREEIKKFWNDVNECLMEIRRSKIVLIEDINERVENSDIACVVGKLAVDGVN